VSGFGLARGDPTSVKFWVFCLVLFGAARCVLELAIMHPRMVRFANEGRPVLGSVVTNNARALGHRTGRYSVVGAADSELGWQVVETPEVLAVGEARLLLCLTPLRRCEVASKVGDYVATWPASAGMLTGFGGIALGGVLAAVKKGVDRRRVAAARRQIFGDFGDFGDKEGEER
jgi:hypothetical protein